VGGCSRIDRQREKERKEQEIERERKEQIKGIESKEQREMTIHERGVKRERKGKRECAQCEMSKNAHRPHHPPIFSSFFLYNRIMYLSAADCAVVAQQ